MKLAVASKRDLKLAWMLHRNIGRLEYSYLNSESKQQRIQKHIMNILDAMGTGGVSRIVMGYEVLRDNCTDPELDHLDFNQKIKSAFALFDAQSVAPDAALEAISHGH